ncbi:hypothetical protein NMY22_g15270 [Coprinellus aureogranulatus]|nr:hypothetical protein NMY22_g15270 [Coprinellus aureogranulatus]
MVPSRLPVDDSDSTNDLVVVFGPSQPAVPLGQEQTSSGSELREQDDQSAGQDHDTWSDGILAMFLSKRSKITLSIMLSNEARAFEALVGERGKVRAEAIDSLRSLVIYSASAQHFEELDRAVGIRIMPTRRRLTLTLEGPDGIHSVYLESDIARVAIAVILLVVFAALGGAVIASILKWSQDMTPVLHTSVALGTSAFLHGTKFLQKLLSILAVVLHPLFQVQVLAIARAAHQLRRMMRIVLELLIAGLQALRDCGRINQWIEGASRRVKSTSKDPMLGSKSSSHSLNGDAEDSKSHLTKANISPYAPLREKIVYDSSDSLFISPNDLEGFVPSESGDDGEQDIVHALGLNTLFPELQPFGMLDVAPPAVVEPTKKRSSRSADKDDPNKRIEETNYTKVMPASRFMTVKPTLLGPLQPVKNLKDRKCLPMEELRQLPKQTTRLASLARPLTSPSVPVYDGTDPKKPVPMGFKLLDLSPHLPAWKLFFWRGVWRLKFYVQWVVVLGVPGKSINAALKDSGEKKTGAAKEGAKGKKAAAKTK